MMGVIDWITEKVKGKPYSELQETIDSHEQRILQLSEKIDGIETRLEDKTLEAKRLQKKNKELKEQLAKRTEHNINHYDDLTDLLQASQELLDNLNATQARRREARLQLQRTVETVRNRVQNVEPPEIIETEGLEKTVEDLQ